jgi:hypothetical protein
MVLESVSKTTMIVMVVVVVVGGAYVQVCECR